MTTDIDKLTDNLSGLDIGDDLSDMQKKAYELFKAGQSLFILGAGGVGKTTLIKTMKEYIIKTNNKKICLTSTTGISSYFIGGVTIHSFMGIGTGNQSIEYLIKRIKRNKAISERISSTDILVIDEISMLSASIFEKINSICKYVRKNTLFMGGIQVVLTGDLMQLLCVFNQNIEIYKEPEDTRLIIESDEFNNKFNKTNKNIIILDKNFRQSNDSEYFNLLSRIRLCDHTNNDIEMLENKCNNFETEYSTLLERNIIPVHLVATNKKAQLINNENLQRLKGSAFNYIAKFTKIGSNKECIDILQKELETQLKQKSLIELRLKNNARVMLIKNLDVSLGLINGATGTIVNLSKDIVEVMFDNGQFKRITKENFELEMNNNIVRATQIPLILAYSITCHKSQSITLDYAIMDLENCFCDHQVYTALSRVKNFTGLLLKSFNSDKIKVNQKMKTYVKSVN
jgi:ATP-dependent DNA helicase PIF1